MVKPRVAILALGIGLVIFIISDSIFYLVSHEISEEDSNPNLTKKSTTSSIYNPYSKIQNIKQSPIVNELWSFDTGRGFDGTSNELTGVGYGAPLLCDIDNDNITELIFGSLDYNLYVLNVETGIEEWRYETAGRLDSWIAVGDVDADNKLEIVIVSDDNHLYVLNGEDGKECWKKAFPEPLGCATIGDINNDNKLEIVIGSEDNNIYALNGENGSQVWKYAAGDNTMYSAVIGDINNDEKLEVIIGSEDNNLYALNGDNGEELWFHALDGVVGSPVLTDIGNDKHMEIIVCTSDHLYALRTEKNLGESEREIWKRRIIEIANQIPILGDLNNDGILDIFVSSYSGENLAIDGQTGDPIWTFRTKEDVEGLGSRIISSASLGDIDNDSRLEIVQSCSTGLFALEADTGFFKWNITLGDDKYVRGDASPVIGDIDNDGMLEIIACNRTDVTDSPDISFPTVFAWDLVESGQRIYWQGMYGVPTRNSTPIYTRNLESVDPDLDFLSTYSEEIFKTDPLNNDTDEDGLPDGWEVTFSLDPSLNDANSDSDLDELTNIQEFNYKTNPTDDDSDGDSMHDGWEVRYGLDPRIAATPSDDLDEDGLDDITEYFYKTEPNNTDTDNDMLSDGEEVHQSGTNPKNKDHDGDTLYDGWEVHYGLDPKNSSDKHEDLDNDNLSNYDEFHTFHTKPNNNDTDFDELSDYDEVTIHFTNATNNDTDGDIILDGWEVKYNLDPNNDDAMDDPDQDNLTNYQEYYLYLTLNWPLNATNNDTDGDTLLDGEEYNLYKTNPTSNDTDNDKLPDNYEIKNGLNASNNDTDGDGDSDYDELHQFLLDPRNALLNSFTRDLILIIGLFLGSLLLIGGMTYRFLYIPKRSQIRGLVLDWWDKNVSRTFHKEEEALKHAKEYLRKGHEITKTFEEED
ncbi:MAG: FG-GAP-like repeat-containing protein [Candidatus Kariarchaeaceae archaeon]